jgi:hypothetical protein
MDFIFDSSKFILMISRILITTQNSIFSLNGISIICHNLISDTKKSGMKYVSHISLKVLKNGEIITYILIFN